MDIIDSLLPLLLALLVGAALAVVFFAGLWWTVTRAVSSKYTGLLLISSLLLRTAIIVTGFYVVSDGQWQRLLSCLLGFIVIRSIAMRIVYRQRDRQTLSKKRLDHAPES